MPHSYVATLSQGWMSQEGVSFLLGALPGLAHSLLLYLCFEDSKQRLPVSQWEEVSMNKKALEM